MSSELMARLRRRLGLDARTASAASAAAPTADPTDRLLADRMVLLGTPLDDQVAEVVIAKLLYLEHRSATEPVTLCLNSPGGLVSAAIAVHDTVRSLAAPVGTLCLGQAHGVAALLLAAGRRGARAAVPGATILLTRIEGRAAPADLRERAEQALLERLAEATGQRVEALRELTDAGAPLGTAEALLHGFIDRVTAARGG